MRMKIINRALLTIAFVITCFFLSYLVSSIKDTYYFRKEAASLNDGRPAGAEMIPHPPAEVSELRIKAVSREYFPYSLVGKTEENYSLIQIWYGFFSNGQWKDYPCENYDLVGILDAEGRSGWKAANDHHMVKIGSYVLISIAGSWAENEHCTITDNIGSEVFTPLADYVSYSTDSHQYGLLAENPAQINGTGKQRNNVEVRFRNRYYVILELDSLPDDYEMVITRGKERYSLDKNAILLLLD